MADGDGGLVSDALSRVLPISIAQVGANPLADPDRDLVDIGDRVFTRHDNLDRRVPLARDDCRNAAASTHRMDDESAVVRLPDDRVPAVVLVVKTRRR